MIQVAGKIGRPDTALCLWLTVRNETAVVRDGKLLLVKIAWLVDPEVKAMTQASGRSWGSSSKA